MIDTQGPIHRLALNHRMRWEFDAVAERQSDDPLVILDRGLHRAFVPFLFALFAAIWAITVTAAVFWQASIPGLTINWFVLELAIGISPLLLTMLWMWVRIRRGRRVAIDHGRVTLDALSAFGSRRLGEWRLSDARLRVRQLIVADSRRIRPFIGLLLELPDDQFLLSSRPGDAATSLDKLVPSITPTHPQLQALAVERGPAVVVKCPLG